MTRSLLLTAALITLHSAPAAAEPWSTAFPKELTVGETLDRVFATQNWLKALDTNWVKNGGKISADLKQTPPAAEPCLSWLICDGPNKGRLIEVLQPLPPPKPDPPKYRNATWQEVEAVRGLSGVKSIADKRTFQVTHPPTGRNLLPPEEYDIPYEGKLVVTLVDSEAEVMKQCPKTNFPAKLGCAFQFRQIYPGGPYAECRIIMPKEEIIESWGFSLATIYRHEIGHCNGWPGDHKAARVA